MKGSLSRNRIIELFDQTDMKFTILTFDEDGKRKLTICGLNVFRVLSEIGFAQHKGHKVLILFPGDKFDKRSEFLFDHIDDVPEELIWKPNWREIEEFER